MDYSGDLSRFQRAASETGDYNARRAAVLATLALGEGETVLEVGCGGGLLTQRMALAVGTSGRTCAIDLSEDQLTAARENCAGLANAEIQIGSALALPYPAGTFDAVASIQVLEYIADVETALAEMHRVLKPGGRFVNFATVWGSLFWNSHAPSRTQQILQAWDTHAPYPNFPAMLRRLLVEAGCTEVTQSPVTILNLSYNPCAFSYWLARIIARFAVDRQHVSAETAAQWLDDLSEVQGRNEYLFSSVAVVTRAVR